MTYLTQAHAPDISSQTTPVLGGHIVVFTGKLASLGRRDARELVVHLGGAVQEEVTGRTTILVVGLARRENLVKRAANSTESLVSKSRKLKRAEAVNSRSPGQIKILNEDDFCQLTGVPTDKFLQRRYHSLRQVKERYPLIRESHLRYLEKWGLVRPVARSNADTYYGFADVAVLKQVHDELQQDGSFRGSVRRRLAAREGQLTLNFAALRSDARPAKVVTLRRRETTKILSASTSDSGNSAPGVQGVLATRFFLEGSELDEGGEADRDRARTAYRKALLLDPNLVPAIVNLANLHYANDDLVEAQALYVRALMLDPDCFEAHFNLGNIHHDLSRYQEAMDFYHEALRLNPTYADAHFYLAVTLEKMGRSAEAKTHWRNYQQLAPDGEWFDLAKEFSE